MSEIEILMEHAFQARRENRPEDAKRFLLVAVEISRSSESRDALARALTGLGQIERDLNHSGAALGHYEEAAAIYRSQKNSMRLAHTVRHVGDIYRHERRHELAAPCYEEALAIYRAQEETSQLDLANALRGLAILKEETGDAPRARLAWQEAKELYAAVNVEAGVVESARRIEILAAAR
jgi:tetratricopeptide (TPR) repeat protein